MGPEDLRIFYQFTGDRAAELAQQYETQAEKDVSFRFKTHFPDFFIDFLKSDAFTGVGVVECSPRPKHEGRRFGPRSH
jgi:hypothetical protein